MAASAAVDVRGGQAHVGARGKADLVLAAFVDKYEANPGRGLVIPGNVLQVDAFGLVSPVAALAVFIAAQLAHKGHVGAQAGGGDGLVGALAAQRFEEMRAGHGFTRLWQAGKLDHQVGVGAADHHDFGTVVHKGPLSDGYMVFV